jgi:hypothetical protein
MPGQVQHASLESKSARERLKRSSRQGSAKVHWATPRRSAGACASWIRVLEGRTDRPLDHASAHTRCVAAFILAIDGSEVRDEPCIPGCLVGANGACNGDYVRAGEQAQIVGRPATVHSRQNAGPFHANTHRRRSSTSVRGGPYFGAGRTHAGDLEVARTARWLTGAGVI